MRVVVRAYPGAARSHVGGRYGDPPALIVRVSARAVDGKANDAVLSELAQAFGVSRSAVRLISGAKSRTKGIEIEGGDPRRLAELLAEGD